MFLGSFRFRRSSFRHSRISPSPTCKFMDVHLRSRPSLSSRRSWFLDTSRATLKRQSQALKHKQPLRPHTFSDNTSQVSSVEDQSNFTAPSVEEIDPENQPSGSKGATYENLKGLPNIHAGLHLWDVARVWSNCRHIYTLLREDKHRKYKREIPKMNHRNIASQIISLERVRKTINFGVMGTFRYSYPAVHKAFMVVKKECGSLFKAFNKQGLIGAREEDEVIEPDYIIPDGEHQIPALQHFISASQVLQQHDELLRVLQPHREPELGKFHTLFRLAMLEEYGREEILTISTNKLRWAKKLSFTTPYVLTFEPI